MINIKFTAKVKFMGWKVWNSSSIPKVSRNSYIFENVQTSSVAQPAPCSVVISVYFLGGKAAGA